MKIRNFKAYIPFFCIGIICIIALCYGLLWVCVMLLSSASLFYLISYGIGKIRESIFKNFLQISLSTGFIFIGTIVLRLFVLDIYTIPSESMLGTLKKGDVILVNKLIYGPRIPESIDEVPWFKIFSYFDINFIKVRKNNIHKRFAGVSEIKQKDIVVFQLKKRKNKKAFKETLVKRCIGLPGDTILIKNGEVLVNNIIVSPTPKTRYRFKITLNTPNDFVDKLSSFGIRKEDIVKKERKILFVYTSIGVTREIRKCNEVLSIELAIDEVKEKQFLLGKAKNKNWTLDNMGPFVVPKNGMEIEMTPYNHSLYRRIFKMHEGFDNIKFDSKVVDNSYKNRKYIFKNDYYFLMGDNRKKSMDSRMFGFIPKDGVIGKVQTIVSKK